MTNILISILISVATNAAPVGDIASGTLTLTNHTATAEEIVAYLKQETNYTAALDLLTTSGEICKVRGHQWFTPPHLTLEYRPEPFEERKCALCGKVESRSMPAWPSEPFDWPRIWQTLPTNYWMQPVPMPLPLYQIKPGQGLSLTNLAGTNIIWFTNTNVLMNSGSTNVITFSPQDMTWTNMIKTTTPPNNDPLP